MSKIAALAKLFPEEWWKRTGLFGIVFAALAFGRWLIFAPLTLPKAECSCHDIPDNVLWLIVACLFGAAGWQVGKRATHRPDGAARQGNGNGGGGER